MSDEGEKTCPLCAEEMDLTDRQLKPCKCGYQICVWCWHHIMDMAEKDDAEGRCPACRAPYNKEKIVGMAANCEKLVAEMNMEKKGKAQKGKQKASEARKQLTSVRVIQRNLVYIVGLPLNLADEDLLQRKEYFGQYGKVLKVSISRTAAGAIQHFANNTCSVYITYAKEDEAVRCIQSVHGFVLDGRPLRACFGTTKYCHAWLRNVPCSNPDCLYLHEIGSQEDSFTKDEIISAYTRSRVQQITGATNSFQRRSGSMLPPPADDYCISSSVSLAKPVNKNTSNNPSSAIRSSPPNSSSGRSVALPAGASWGVRASNNQLPPSSSPSNGLHKQKLDTCSGPIAFSTAVASSASVSLAETDAGKKLYLGDNCRDSEMKGKFEALDLAEDYIGEDSGNCGPDISPTKPIPPSTPTVTSTQHYWSSNEEKEGQFFRPSDPHISVGSSLKLTGPGSGNDLNIGADVNLQSISTDGNQTSQQGYIEQYGEPLASQVLGKITSPVVETGILEKSDQILDPVNPLLHGSSYGAVDGLLPFSDQRHKDPEYIAKSSYLTNFSDSSHLSSVSSSDISAADIHNISGVDKRNVDRKVDSSLQVSGFPVISNGFQENLANGFSDSGNIFGQPYVFSNEDTRMTKGTSVGQMTSNDGALDMGESSIISNILSLDLDSWDESLTSPQNLVKLLGQKDKQQGSFRASNSWKAPQSNQSRFSFAREEPINQASENYFEQAFKHRAVNDDFSDERSFQFDKFDSGNGLPFLHNDASDYFGGGLSHSFANKLQVSRSQISAPPGFSAPGRAPPPGFNTHERLEQIKDPLPGNNIFDTSNFLRNQFQPPPLGNLVSNGDIELIDPAILAVGKGRLPNGINSPGLEMRSSLPPHLSTFENEARLQLLMQRSLSSHPNQRFAEMSDGFSSAGDAYGIPHRVMEQTLANNLSSFSQLSLPSSRNPVTSNGHWDGWNEVQGGNDFSMAELLRNERLGYNKYYTGFEDSKFRMPSSGDLYNRTFGI